eukprot:CFRG7958T1
MTLNATASFPLFEAQPEQNVEMVNRRKTHASLLETKHPSWLALNGYHIPDEAKPEVYSTWFTRDGKELLVMREIGTNDKQLVVEAFNSLSADSIRRRFCYDKDSLSDEELQMITQCDFIHDYTIVVVVSCPCKKNDVSLPQHVDVNSPCQTDKIVGVGQYISLTQNNFEAELAFLVTDDYQGQGIARRMLDHLLVQAKLNGFITMRVDTQYDNLKMQHLITHNCADTKLNRDGQEVSMTIPVPECAKELGTNRSIQKMHKLLG